MSQTRKTRRAALVVMGGSGRTPNSLFGKDRGHWTCEPEQTSRARAFLEQALTANLLVIFVSPNGDLPDAPPWAATTGTPSQIVVKRRSPSAFLGTDLDLLLRSSGIETLLLLGKLDEVGAESTLREASALGYRTVLVSDLARTSDRVLRWADHVAQSSEVFGADEWPTAAIELRSNDLSFAEGIRPCGTALVLIDLQNDFCHPEAEMAKRGLSLSAFRSAVAAAVSLVEAARRAGILVVHVRSEYGPKTRGIGGPFRLTAQNRDGGTATLSAAVIAEDFVVPSTYRGSCYPGTWGEQIVAQVSPRPEEPVVTKHRINGFVDTNLHLVLRANGIQTIVFAGVTTNCCVESAVRDASSRDYQVIVAEDAVATVDEQIELHEHSLHTMGRYFGEVRQASGIARGWTERADDAAPSKT